MLALQIGGSLEIFFGKIVHLDDEDRHVLIMCGMSAAFAALFGTPMAAAVFSMGNGQCRYHGLFRISPLCNVCADWCSPCFYVWCSCRKIYNCSIPSFSDDGAAKNSSSWNLVLLPLSAYFYALSFTKLEVF